MKNTCFNPLAEQELFDAANYYQKQEFGLGLRYLDEVEQAINFIVRYPEAGFQVRGSIRRILLPKFPYFLVYRVLPDQQIRILAVAHHKRRPEYWSTRN
jgi:toxin ParE1/3/4